MALKLLKSQNKLKTLPMMQKETVTVFILGATSLAGINYASLRGNETAAVFVKKPNHHDLSHMILGLKSSLGDPLKVKEVITRYATMLRVSDAMKAALRAICAWPVDCLELLVSILSKYEVFETADTDENLMKRSQSLIQEGKKLVMPVKMFNELSRLPHEYLREQGEAVVGGRFAVKMLVKKHVDDETRKRKVAKIEEVSGHKSIASLRLEFPEKFTNDIVDKFPGVKVSSNQQCLENYTRQVVNNPKGDEPKFDELEIVEREADLREMKSLLKFIRRPLVKEEIINSIKKLEDKIKDLNNQVKMDSYEFAPPHSSTRKSVTEELDDIAEGIDDDVGIDKVTEDSKSGDSD